MDEPPPVSIAMLRPKCPRSGKEQTQFFMDEACFDCVAAERKTREDAERPLREARQEATDDFLGVMCPQCRPGSTGGCPSCIGGWVRLPRHLRQPMPPKKPWWKFW